MAYITVLKGKTFIVCVQLEVRCTEITYDLCLKIVLKNDSFRGKKFIITDNYGKL